MREVFTMLSFRGTFRLFDTYNEEISLNVQGFMTANTFPPVSTAVYVLLLPCAVVRQHANTANNRPKDQRRFFSQKIQLTGFGDNTFAHMVEAIQRIRDHMESVLPEGSVEAWVPDIFQTHETIAVATRYLTPAKDAAPEEILTPSHDIDPNGCLQNMMGGEYVYTIDNEVVYCEAYVDAENVRWVLWNDRLHKI